MRIIRLRAPGFLDESSQSLSTTGLYLNGSNLNNVVCALWRYQTLFDQDNIIVGACMPT